MLFVWHKDSSPPGRLGTEGFNEGLRGLQAAVPAGGMNDRVAGCWGSDGKGRRLYGRLQLGAAGFSTRRGMLNRKEAFKASRI